MRSFPEGKCFEMAMVHPAVVMGPLLSKEVSGKRLAMHRQLLEHKINRVPNVNMPLVDVRDVALAHISALTAQGAADHRHLLVAESIWFTSTARILSEEFSKYGYDVPTKKASYISLWLSGRFDPKKRRLLTTLNREFKLDNTRMKKVLGIIPRSTATTLIDMGYSMIDKGVVKKMPNYGSRDTGEHHLYKKRGRVTRWMRQREYYIISVVMQCNVSYFPVARCDTSTGRDILCSLGPHLDFSLVIDVYFV